ncbi:MAG: hypothetical protein AAF767_04600 [Pseudomonadota bacterium]
MSRLTPLSLPRFHTHAPAPTLKQNPALPHDAAAPNDFTIEAEDSAPADATLDAEGSRPEGPHAGLPEIDTGAILNSLSTAMEGLQHAALAHSQQAVAEFLRAAFPALSEAFLGEEIVRAVGEMMPPDIERLQLRVPVHFETAFHRALQSSPELNEICEVHPTAEGDAILVDIDWGDGGLQFDMDAFLESSLGRLHGSTDRQEGQNV